MNKLSNATTKNLKWNWSFSGKEVDEGISLHTIDAQEHHILVCGVLWLVSFKRKKSISAGESFRKQDDWFQTCQYAAKSHFNIRVCLIPEYRTHWLLRHLLWEWYWKGFGLFVCFNNVTSLSPEDVADE